MIHSNASAWYASSYGPLQSYLVGQEELETGLVCTVFGRVPEM